MIWYIYIYEETLKKKKKKKKELPMCSKDLDNPTYGLFKRPGRYTYQPWLTIIHSLRPRHVIP
jgi:hypothetical protein